MSTRAYYPLRDRTFRNVVDNPRQYWHVLIRYFTRAFLFHQCQTLCIFAKTFFRTRSPDDRPDLTNKFACKVNRTAAASHIWQTEPSSFNFQCWMKINRCFVRLIRCTGNCSECILTLSCRPSCTSICLPVRDASVGIGGIEILVIRIEVSNGTGAMRIV